MLLGKMVILEELRKRKREFGKNFLEGLIVFKNVVVSEKTILEFSFSCGDMFDETSDRESNV